MRSEEGSHSGRRPVRRTEIVFEALEPRLLLSGSDAADPFVPYLPEQHYLFESGGYLTEASVGEPLDIAMGYLTSHAAELGLASADFAQSTVTNLYTSADTGITHIYLRQMVNGLEIDNANISVNVTADGRILNIGGAFVSLQGLAAQADAAVVAAPDALVQAGLTVGLTSDLESQVTEASDGTDQAMVLVNADYSLDPIPARLHYVVTGDGIELAWEMVMRTADLQHWYEVSVDATSGECLRVSDWADAATYNVYPAPTESPDDGDRTLVTDPADPNASPYGWHDTDGAAGAEYTDTRGNNVFAQEDADHNNTGGTRPDGGTDLVFDFPLDLTQDPSASQSAAITNLFYWNNYLHDLHYEYGFDEASGNFQMLNYTGEGEGGDPVIADAQDGSGYNNSNFSTPPEGQSPRMQMYLFTYNTPMRDGSLDCQIIIHEYGHGISDRLVGGASNTDALDARQSRAMSEGLGDWWALMLTMKSADTIVGAYPFGAYAMGNPDAGPGLRKYSYSYDMSIDPLTFGDIPSNTEVHDMGVIYCSALWDMSWLLIDKYGFSENMAGGYDPDTPGLSAGNNLAMRLVMDSLKLMPVNPSFLDGRDALLQADQVLTGGANSELIWQAFARRGMGLSADGGEDANSTYVTEAFDTPSENVIVVNSTPEGPAGVPVSELTFHFNKAVDPASFSIADDVVSFTGPGGADLVSAITAATWDDPQTLRIRFVQQVTPGPYALTIGPHILSADGHLAMDQDADGTAGESVDDLYTATFEGVQLIYSADMSTDPGWTLDPGTEAPYQWEYGTTAGLDGDPTSGHTGDNVIGYNLQGLYPNEMDPAQYATTPAFSTVGYSDVTVGFWQWLGVEASIYDTAGLEVWDGSQWLTVWQHEGDSTLSSSWEYVQYALPASAANQPEVMLRWTMGPSDVYVNFCGWNIDDVTVWGTVPGTDIVGPKATAEAPATPTGGHDRAVFHFDEAMDTSSFGPAEDIVSFTGPSGDLTGHITGYAWLDQQTLEVRFDTQTRAGSYTIIIGPNITDNGPSLNPMDQDGDGTSGEPEDRCGISFEISGGPPVVYSADMSVDPGWTYSYGGTDGWAYGVPAGNTGDPTSGYTGDNVVGYNLEGSYQNNIKETRYATTPAFSTVGYADVKLEFRYWLTIEESRFDHADIQVWDGSNWITLWDHEGKTFISKDWRFWYFELPESAWNQPEIMIRWGLGPTDSGGTGCGWNIDDVIVTGTPVTDPAVVGRYVFYNNSVFDGNNAGANASDDNAIAPPPSLYDPSEADKQLGKQALLPGQTASAVNYTNYSRGLNGIMVDIVGLGGREVSAADFTFLVGNSLDPSEWTAAPAPLSVTVRPGAGADGSDRVTISWADDDPLTDEREPGSISNQWLQVTVLSDANGGSLGLADDDVFYFGNAIGETYNSTTDAKVNATDILGVRGDTHLATNPATIYDAYDFDKDGIVSAQSADELIVSRNQTNFMTALVLFTAPETSAAPVGDDPSLYYIVGDATMDGKVDAADLVVVASNLGLAGATWAQGDFDGNGTVDVNDYIAIKQHFGESAPVEAPAAPVETSDPTETDADTTDNEVPAAPEATTDVLQQTQPLNVSLAAQAAADLPGSSNQARVNAALSSKLPGLIAHPLTPGSSKPGALGADTALPVSAVARAIALHMEAAKPAELATSPLVPRMDRTAAPVTGDEDAGADEPVEPFLARLRPIQWGRVLRLPLSRETGRAQQR